MQDISKIRNIAIIGHGNCGKTSLAEAMLFTAGKIKRLGKVDDGSSALDFEEEEQQRNISISTAFHNYSWDSNRVFLLDTPGDDNFINESYMATQVADSAIFLIGAVLGVKGQTIKFADFINASSLPSLIMINKLDRERANFSRTLEQIQDLLPVTAVVLQLPIGEEENFSGLVDVMTNTAHIFDASGSGKTSVGEVPEEMLDMVAQYRESLMEQVAETDDDLIEKFLEDGELSLEDLHEGLKNGVASGAIVPVCVGAATRNFGTSTLLDIINSIMPSPMDRPAALGVDAGGEPIERMATADEKFSAQVFKTMADPYAGRLTIFKVCSGTLSGDHFYNSNKETEERFGQLFIPEGKEQHPVDSAVPGMIVAVAKLKETTTGDTLCDPEAPILFDELDVKAPVMSYAIHAGKGDEEKLFSSITRMLDEDLTLRLTREAQTGEVLISGVGKVHLDVVGARINRKFGVEMELSLPKIPYKETIKGSVTVQGKHKKQSGGRGQFGDCTIEISPTKGNGFEFEDKIVGGVIPQQYRPAVEKGIIEAMEKGVMAGYPVVDIKISLVDGSFHNVDSSEMAFKIAGSQAFKKGAQEAGPVLLEPYVDMTIKVTKEHVGDVMGDLNSRRGKVMGMDTDQGREVINAQVPHAEVLLYAADLTAMTGGLGTFSVAFSHYEEVPAQIAEKIVAASAAA
jgi:elongation factor G